MKKSFVPHTLTAPRNVGLLGYAGRRWLWVLLLYAIASLLWIGRFDAVARLQRPPVHSPTREFFASEELASLPVIAKDVNNSLSNEALFIVPFEIERMEQTDRYRFQIPPFGGSEQVAIQVIVEGDHRYSYAHTYTNVALPERGFAFEAPLTGADAAAYWRPVGHSGMWSDWERSGLRRMEVKIFVTSPVPDSLVCHYVPVPAAHQDGIRLAWSTPKANPIPLGARFELAFDLAGWHGNPFDNEAFPVVLEVTPPGGAPLRISPFLHQNFEAEGGLGGETIFPRGPKHFLVRYRPGQTGDHAYRLLLRDNDDTERAVKTGRLIVSEGMPPDFLRVSTRSPRYFEHADGRFFYAIGWNLPYPVDQPYGQNYVPYIPDGNTLAFKRKLLDDLADAGGNFARFWLSDWWNGLEWHRDTDTYPGLGRYNLKNAWLNDQILEHCERRGIYLQFETLNHVRLQPGYGWPQHPYNIRNGGFLKYPWEFWTHTLTEAFSRRRLAYLMARYADSPAIHSIGVMSEPDIVSGGHWGVAKRWILSQLQTIQALDPYDRITVNQICIPNHDTGFFRETPVQFVSSNAYPDIGALPDEQIMAIRTFAGRYVGHGKPVMVAEAAGHWAGDPDYKMRRDTLGALWGGVASGLAGTPLSWWWNFNYGEDLGHWYRVVADFMQGEDLIVADAPEYGGWHQREVSSASRTGNLRALMVGNAIRRYLFVYNFDTLARTRGKQTRCEENRIVFEGMHAGDYQAEYWDLHTGRTGLIEPLTIGPTGVAKLDPPAFTEGWAIKIVARETTALPRAPGAAYPVTTDVPAKEPEQSDGLSGWSWRIRPLTPIIAPEAMERVVIEAYIGLPDELRRHVPQVTNPDGTAIPVFWESLAHGAGWRLVMRPRAANALTVTAVPPDVGGERIEAHSLPRGLLLTVAPNRSAPLLTVDAFEQRFVGLPDRKHAPVDKIDQVENPLGDNQHFLSVYQGPLLAPYDGDYIFATNSDDGSFVKINGAVVVAWPPPHNMEVHDRPAANLWRHRGRITLPRGLHWVEYLHQQGGGATLARLGWQTPLMDAEDFRLIGVPADPPQTPSFEVVPAWALDGVMPCAVDIIRDGKPQLTLLPTQGLELRRPRATIPVIRWVEPEGTEQIRHVDGEGRYWLPAGGTMVPVWAWNAHHRPFSMEWEVLAPAEEGAVLRTLLYDIKLPLTVNVGDRQGGTRIHARRAWETWPLSDEDAATGFEVMIDGVTLLSARLPAWPAEPGPPRTRTRDFAIDNLIEAGLLRPEQALNGRYFAADWRGTPPDAVMPGWRRADPWAGDPEIFVRQLETIPPRTGVILRFDQRTRLLGLTDRQLSVRLHAIMQAVRNAGAEPVLVLSADIDLRHPATRSAAVAFHRLSRTFGCPFIDLREPAP